MKIQIITPLGTYTSLPLPLTKGDMILSVELLESEIEDMIVNPTHLTLDCEDGKVIFPRETLLNSVVKIIE